MYIKTSNNVKITVMPCYNRNLSDLESNKYVWDYNIVIENCGGTPVKLVSRKWKIFEANGETIEIKGEGVVGQQPLIRPGESFGYTSHASIKSPSAIMEGVYIMQRNNGELFESIIPAFSLDHPELLKNLN